MLKFFIVLQGLVAERVDKVKDRGATAVEYGLMVALIAVVIILAVTAIGTRLRGVFEDVRDALPV